VRPKNLQTQDFGPDFTLGSRSKRFTTSTKQFDVERTQPSAKGFYPGIPGWDRMPFFGLQRGSKPNPKVFPGVPKGFFENPNLSSTGRILTQG